VVAATSVALVLAIVGCGAGGNTVGMRGMDHESGSASPGVTVPGAVAMADSMFVMMMIPHHEQAIEMSDLILDEGAIEMAEDELDDGADPEVRALALSIVESQTAEIATMIELLKSSEPE